MKKILLTYLVMLVALSTGAQTNSIIANRIRAIDYLQIGSSTSQRVTGFDITMPGVPTDMKLPTTKLLVDWVSLSAVLNGATAGGDLSGIYPNPTVDGLLGRPLSATPPNLLDVLKWSGSQWVPLPDDNSGTAYTEGTGIDISLGNIISADTSVLATVYDAASVFRLWPQGTVSSYQSNNTKRNWIIYNSLTNPSSTANSFARFDSISTHPIYPGGNTTNTADNGLWMSHRSATGAIVSGFSNNLQNGMGFSMFINGLSALGNWKDNTARGSVLKAYALQTTGPPQISFFRTSYSSTNPTTQSKLVAGSELGAIRFMAGDTTKNLTATDGLLLSAPSSAIVGYTYKVPFSTAHYGGVGLWSTNGSLIQNRLFRVDSTVSVDATNLDITGNVRLNTSGNKIFVKTGTNASAGTGTLIAGVATINTTAVTANSIIIVKTRTVITADGTLSTPQAQIIPFSRFGVVCSNPASASTFDWWVIN